MARPLEHLVLFSVVATDSRDEGEENLIVQLAWEIVSISKNQRLDKARTILACPIFQRNASAAFSVLLKDQVHVCPGGGAPGNLPSGINPEAVQAAGNLDSALKQLGGSTFSLMTFGPGPLRGLLHPQAYKICLGLQKYLHRYLDIVKEFARAFPTTPVPTTVDKMASLIGIGSEGSVVRPGMEELSVMAQVAQKLILQGHIFQSQEIIRDDIKLDVSPDPNLVKEGCVVILRGLPFQVSLKDVAGFLSGLNCIPGGLVFGINSVGRRTGEAIAVLETPEQAQLALQRHKQYLNQRYIEVFAGQPKDFSRMVGGGGGTTGVCVVRLQGLPYRINEKDIVDFFGSAAKVKGGKDGVMIVHYSDGKATGDGFALFENDEDLTRALQLNKSMMGQRYVELYKSSVKEFEMVLSRSGTTEEQQHFSGVLGLEITPNPELEGLKGSKKNCVKLRGIPYSASPEDVIVFFGDLKEDIALQGIHMVLNTSNRPTGECYVRMKSVEAAMEASDKLHKKYIESRYIEVFQCSGDEVFRALQDQGMGGGGGGRGRGSYRGEHGYRSGGDRGRRGYMDEERRRRPSDGSTSLKIRGLPYSATENDIMQFFAEYEIRNCDIDMIKNNSGRATGIAYVSFPNKELAEMAIKEKDGKHMGARYLELSLNY